MARVAVLEENFIHAACFLGAADTARGASDEAREPAERVDAHVTEDVGRAQIGEAEWDRAREEGRTMPLENALTLARANASRSAAICDGEITR